MRSGCDNLLITYNSVAISGHNGPIHHVA